MESITKIITDKQNSVEVGTNSKGEYQWTVKAYYNMEDAKETLTKILELEEELKKKYGGKRVHE